MAKKRAASKKPTPRPDAPPPDTQSPESSPLPSILTPKQTIELKWTDSERPVKDGGVSALQRAATQWSYLVRNRQRWSGRDSLVIEQSSNARKLLQSFGISGPTLQALATSGTAQVVVPYSVENVGWEGRVFPWEFVLSVATRPIRQGEPLAIFRQLALERSPKKRPANRTPKSVLYVESAPGPLADAYSFESERSLVRTNLVGNGVAWLPPLTNPTRQQLRDAVEKASPDVIHLAGFDTHQGSRLATAEQGRGLRGIVSTAMSATRALAEASTLTDGYVMADDEKGFVAVSSQELAGILNAGSKGKPLLVTCNIWNSARRICPTIIAEGAAAAIGFQDSFDDGVVEAFFSTLYRSWRDAGWDLRTGFLEAWNRVRQHPAGLIGTGLVLWTDAPIVGAGTERAASETARYDRLQKEREKATQTLLDPKTEDVSALLKYDIEPISELNYSLLHNKRPLFKAFKLLKQKPGRMTNVTVSADLNAGGMSFPYRKVFEITGAKGDPFDLTTQIHASLTADLARSIRESVNTSLFVEISWAQQLLYRDTHRVRLLPADQWRDTDEDRLWLPCFVLPRDPAIEGIIAKAHRYVRVLRDDPAAGFDGYQSVDEDREDPTEDVDLQVQAIWAAIVHECQLGYINPPPSYSQGQDSQRLRTPSAVLADKCGTCIDLALLFAGCLELVDIYPVIFLLKEHAFPGYWRSETARDAFMEMRESRDRSSNAGLAPAGRQAERWVSGAIAYDEIVQQVDDGDLVPIESVKLTENCGFWEAVDAGKENLRPKREFDSMLDILSAREECVTPLPITDSRL
jgi:hypothetical protein